jgi:F0F1-type ATP synthase assembly protein I
VADQSPGWPELLGMGGIVAAQVAVGCVLGLLIDRAAGTSPIFLLVGLGLGLVGGVAYMVVQFRKFLRNN